MVLGNVAFALGRRTMTIELWTMQVTKPDGSDGLYDLFFSEVEAVEWKPPFPVKEMFPRQIMVVTTDPKFVVPYTEE
jgi:hypothetical protein